MIGNGVFFDKLKKRGQKWGVKKHAKFTSSLISPFCEKMSDTKKSEKVVTFLPTFFYREKIRGILVDENYHFLEEKVGDHFRDDFC